MRIVWRAACAWASMTGMNEQLIRAIELADDGNWDEAHRIVQQFEDPLACWLHANLHREEGDLGNAQYWYRRAGKSSVDVAFAEERSVIRKVIEDGP
jgi:hypothetical protein